jgi:zinc D-Ala-D-Ala carboxypeptidase
MKRHLHHVSLALGAVVLVGVWAAPASAYEFDRTLRRGDKGKAVRALQVRVAGWFPDRGQIFRIDGGFGRQTLRAVKAFKEGYGLKVNGVAGNGVFEILHRLQDEDGSTKHFDFSEFDQNSNSNCGAKANAYAGTFSGGMVSPRRTRMYVRRLMWRLEAVRKKAGSKPIGINSGFRSVAYNDCIGGARASQHMYGTAVDERQAEVSNQRQRWIAKQSQFHGIGCYSSQTHNHLDLRIENRDLSTQRSWWWPDKDRRGRELDAAGIPCWGEISTSTKVASLRSAVSSSPTPTAAEVARFQSAGEGMLAEGVD